MFMYIFYEGYRPLPSLPIKPVHFCLSILLNTEQISPSLILVQPHEIDIRVMTICDSNFIGVFVGVFMKRCRRHCFKTFFSNDSKSAAVKPAKRSTIHEIKNFKLQHWIHILRYAFIFSSTQAKSDGSNNGGNASDCRTFNTKTKSKVLGDFSTDANSAPVELIDGK